MTVPTESAEERALKLLARGPMSCASLGDALWSTRKSAGNCSCPYARPAGALIKRLRARGLVEHGYDVDHFVYQLTASGRAHVASLP